MKTKTIKRPGKAPAFYVPETVPEGQSRLSPEQLDERYIAAYLDNPAGTKIEALRKAGHPNPTPQRAYHIHERLAEQIDKQLDKLIKQDAALGRATIIDLCKKADSEAVRAQCAQKLMDYAGKQKPERLQIEHKTPDDIDTEIQAIQRRIQDAQGIDQPEKDYH